MDLKRLKGARCNIIFVWLDSFIDFIDREFYEKIYFIGFVKAFCFVLLL